MPYFSLLVGPSLEPATPSPSPAAIRTTGAPPRPTPRDSTVPLHRHCEPPPPPLRQPAMSLHQRPTSSWSPHPPPPAPPPHAPLPLLPPHAPLPLLPPHAPPLRSPPPTLGPHPHRISPRLPVAHLHAPGGRGLRRRRGQGHRAPRRGLWTLSPLPQFLSNWLVSVRCAGRGDQVLVIAKDYETPDRINAEWPGHAVLVPPAPDAQAAHKFGSQGFFNFTPRRPRHLLQILELGYSVMYNDVDMVWLDDPFPYLVGDHDVYFFFLRGSRRVLHGRYDSCT
ncbi:hypothetical protein PVAP13_1KG111723 [Panicum virgatum]|uniref:Nucleotide-diphospho-sugar transferase domain-containing protein n=1 Tax=Panicum virgatum TaxID=38727 RepID=A0A8T0XSC0_PANVG|nr:hypothetical protein PVAP13_1KG111723 [Panicum virgatum]KAG2661903.1 hypothetical protein PVAP13_1KG111723 [Panicum virgatum]